MTIVYKKVISKFATISAKNLSVVSKFDDIFLQLEFILDAHQKRFAQIQILKKFQKTSKILIITFLQRDVKLWEIKILSDLTNGERSVELKHQLYGVVVLANQFVDNVSALVMLWITPVLV